MAHVQSTETPGITGSPATWVYVAEGTETGRQPGPFVVVQRYHHPDLLCFHEGHHPRSSVSGSVSHSMDGGELPLDFQERRE